MSFIAGSASSPHLLLAPFKRYALPLVNPVLHTDIVECRTLHLPFGHGQAVSLLDAQG